MIGKYISGQIVIESGQYEIIYDAEHTGGVFLYGRGKREHPTRIQMENWPALKAEINNALVAVEALEIEAPER